MLLLFFIELLVLFFLSRILTSELSFLFHRIFRSQKVSVILIAIIFFPGTIIHEFSHAIMAKVLFVYVGNMELVPQIQGQSLKLGSVEVGKTDIVRNFLIGVAPFVMGTSLLLFVMFQAFSNSIIGFNFQTIVVLLLVFIISNTMYSSRKDMEGAIEFFLLIIIPIIFLYFIGLRIPGLNLGLLRSDFFYEFTKHSVILLGVPLVLDLGIIVFCKTLLKHK